MGNPNEPRKRPNVTPLDLAKGIIVATISRLLAGFISRSL